MVQHAAWWRATYLERLNNEAEAMKNPDCGGEVADLPD